MISKVEHLSWKRYAKIGRKFSLNFKQFSKFLLKLKIANTFNFAYCKLVHNENITYICKEFCVVIFHYHEVHRIASFVHYS